MHRIHLKGPWEYDPPAAPPTAAPAPPRRAHLPATWQSLFGHTPGTARFRRRFHQPTNLDPHERVFLVFDGLTGHAAISLNNTPLGTLAGTSTTAEFDITPLLTPRNELTIEITFTPTAADHPGGLWAPVALEIRVSG